MNHTPLDPAQLSIAAQRALGPGPARTMAARGMMPLPPADQLAVLYQLSLDPDTMLAQSARVTAAGLPEKLLSGTLADPALDPRIVDYFAQVAGEKPAVFQAIALNPVTDDSTIATLAERAGAREIDLIAQNEQRLLRHPEIIGAMYMNRHARMSTVDRVVELAVRNQVRVPGLAAWDEVARALQGIANAAPSSEMDTLFAIAADSLTGDDAALTTGDADQVIEEGGLATPEIDIDESKIPISKMSIPAKIRIATMGNAFARGVLVRDPVRLVAIAAIKSPGVTDIEAARYAANQSLGEDVIRYIAANRNWTKLYGIKVALCRNPKTPVAEISRILPFLREKDLANLARSKGIPSAVVAQARKLMMQRRGGNK